MARKRKCPYPVDVTYPSGNDDIYCFHSRDEALDFIYEHRDTDPDWKMRLRAPRKSGGGKKRRTCKHGRTQRGTCRKRRRGRR